MTGYFCRAQGTEGTFKSGPERLDHFGFEEDLIDLGVANDWSFLFFGEVQRGKAPREEPGVVKTHPVLKNIYFKRRSAGIIRMCEHVERHFPDGNRGNLGSFFTFCRAIERNVPQYVGCDERDAVIDTFVNVSPEILEFKEGLL